MPQCGPLACREQPFVRLGLVCGVTTPIPCSQPARPWPRVCTIGPRAASGREFAGVATRPIPERGCTPALRPERLAPGVLAQQPAADGGAAGHLVRGVLRRRDPLRRAAE